VQNVLYTLVTKLVSKLMIMNAEGETFPSKTLVNGFQYPTRRVARHVVAPKVSALRTTCVAGLT